MFVLGFSIVVSMRVGAKLGEGDGAGARRAWVAMNFAGGVLIVCIATLVGSLHSVWGYAFTTDPGVLSLVAMWLPLLCILCAPDTIQGIACGVLRGAGRPGVAAASNLLSYVAIGMPLGYALCIPADYGLPGLWIGMGIGFFASSVFLSVTVGRMDWDAAAKTAVKRATSGGGTVDSSRTLVGGVDSTRTLVGGADSTRTLMGGADTTGVFVIEEPDGEVVAPQTPSKAADGAPSTSAPLLLRVIEVAGTPAEMGRSHGEQLAPLIRAFVTSRLAVTTTQLASVGVSPESYLASAAASLDTLQSWDPDGYMEHCAIAQAAGVDPVKLLAAGNMTDLRDVVTLNPRPDGEGCTTVAVMGRPGAAGEDARCIAGQTWDLIPQDLPFIVAVSRRPSHGPPSTWCVTAAGCPGVVGGSSAGLSWGTNNLKVHGVAAAGVPYLCILGRVGACRTRAEAAAVISAAPACAAHVFWLADRSGAEAWETTPDAARVRRMELGVLAQSNHCLFGENAQREALPPSSSSLARLAMATAAGKHAATLPEGGAVVSALRSLFSDRAGGVDGVNRWPEDCGGVTSTNACVVVEPGLRVHACRGPADRGVWVTHQF